MKPNSLILGNYPLHGIQEPEDRLLKNQPVMQGVYESAQSELPLPSSEKIDHSKVANRDTQDSTPYYEHNLLKVLGKML